MKFWVYNCNNGQLSHKLEKIKAQSNYQNVAAAESIMFGVKSKINMKSHIRIVLILVLIASISGGIIAFTNHLTEDSNLKIYESFEKKFNSIKIGDSMDTVRSVLGIPTFGDEDVSRYGAEPNEIFAYGNRVGFFWTYQVLNKKYIIHFNDTPFISNDGTFRVEGTNIENY